MIADYDLPDHFDDKTMIDALKSSFLSDSDLWPFNHNEQKDLSVDPEVRKTFPMICGLLLRLRTGILRIIKRSKMKEVSEIDTFEDRLFRIFRCFLKKSSEDDLLSIWTPETLSMAATELARKSVFLSAKLQMVLNNQPLLPLNKDTKRLEFDSVFLQLVQAYHAGVQRPKGTFNLDTDENQETLQVIDPVHQEIAEIENEISRTQLSDGIGGINECIAGSDVVNAESDGGNKENCLIETDDTITHTLAAIPREVCRLCGGRRQIYCGDCGGVRMDGAISLLPPRVQLPFDVLLVVHWAEDLHKCTGVQAAALCQDGSVTYADWPKTRPRKLSFLCEEPKKKWERMEKKEYNAIKDSTYREKFQGGHHGEENIDNHPDLGDSVPSAGANGRNNNSDVIDSRNSGISGCGNIPNSEILNPEASSSANDDDINSNIINNNDATINHTSDIIAKIKNDRMKSNIGKQYNRRGNKKSVHTNITTENLLDIPNGNCNKKKIDDADHDSDGNDDHQNPNRFTHRCL